VIVGFAQGTGVIAFFDLIQHLVDQQKAAEDHSLSEGKAEEVWSFVQPWWLFLSGLP